MFSHSEVPKTKEVGFSPTLVLLNLRAVMVVWFSPNHETEFSDVATDFRDSFRAEFKGCFMDKFIAINDSLEIC